MRWGLLLVILLLAGCTAKVGSVIPTNETPSQTTTDEALLANNTEETSLDLNIRTQEKGLRLTLEKAYIKQRYLYVEVLGEKLLPDVDVPSGNEFLAYFYYMSGQLHDMKVCGYETIDENTWRGTYCSSLIKMDDRIFSEKTHLVLSTERRQLLADNFIRDVDKRDWTYLFELNFRDTFIKK